MTVPINRDCAADLAAILWTRHPDAILASVQIVTDAIRRDRERLGMTEGEAIDFAGRFAEAVLDEVAELRRCPPMVQ
jgi:hypothetical protein